MKRVTVKRWVALTATDILVLDVPDDWDVNDDDILDHKIVSEDREVIDSTDSGEWMLEDEYELTGGER